MSASSAIPTRRSTASAAPDAACFTRFRQDFPAARTVRLGRNYRSTGTIVAAAAQLIGGGAADDVTRPG
jgi:superfamily I DNA/RNA helicase